ncbi:MAG: hypothetical protein U9R42_04120, partial [Bacteroidota bacterium]|nr:hypothetical protein [Bacteroidota bacterium]
MKKFSIIHYFVFLIFLISFFIKFNTYGQSAGDIAFIGWNSDGDEDILFVTFVDISAGTKIYFRDEEYDNGWASSTGEGTISWTAPSGGISAGTVVQIYDCAVSDPAVPTSSVGTMSKDNAGFNIKNDNDAVYAYTANGGYNTGPFTFLAAFINRAAGYDTTSYGVLMGTNLTDNTDAWSWGSDDNWKYDRSVTSGSVSTIKTALQSSANWNSQNSPNYTFSTSAFDIIDNFELEFDGTNDYVDIGTGPTIVKTVEFWVNPATTTEDCIDLNGSEYIEISSGTLTANGFTSPTIYVNGAVSTSVSASVWQHVAVTTTTLINASDL